jgi:hypothetical protein
MDYDDLAGELESIFNPEPDEVHPRLALSPARAG